MSSKHAQNERLNTAHKLRFQHDIKLLFRISGVNRSTYYNHFAWAPAPRTLENQEIRVKILHIYADYQIVLALIRSALPLDVIMALKSVLEESTG